MRAVVLITFLFCFIFGVSARNYCSTGKGCSNNTECSQYSGSGNNQWGICCNGKCQQGNVFAYRGEYCDNQCVFCSSASSSGSLFCNLTAKVCQATYSTQKCSCSLNSNCTSGFCGTDGKCGLTSEGNGGTCTASTQCLSRNCNSNQCIANEMNATCVYSTNYPETCKNGVCPNWGSDPRTGLCQPRSGVGGPCDDDDECQSGLQCIGNSQAFYDTCQKPPKKGDACLNSTVSIDYPCGNTYEYICNVGKCIDYFSIDDGQVCDNDYACKSSNCNSTTSKCQAISYVPIGQNCTNSNFCADNGYCVGPNFPPIGVCTAQKSVANGKPCYGYSGLCYDGSICQLNYTDFKFYCANIGGKSCNSSSQTPDSTQCASGYYCDCDNICKKSSTSQSCSTYQSQWSALGYPSSMAPLTMPGNVLTAYARYRCCQVCWQGSANARTAYSGYSIGCDSGSGYSVSEQSNCNLQAKDQSQFQSCDKYSGANNIIASPLSFIAALLSALFLFH